MKSTVGVYNSHEKALKAIETLTMLNYPSNKLSIIGQAVIVDDHLRLKSNESLELLGVSIGVVAGPILGMLTGIGIFLIPGFGFLYGAGALVGALAGFDYGLIGGGIASILTGIGIKDEHVVKYDEHLKGGNFLVIAQGTQEEVKKATAILNAHGKHLALDAHI